MATTNTFLFRLSPNHMQQPIKALRRLQLMNITQELPIYEPLNAQRERSDTGHCPGRNMGARVMDCFPLEPCIYQVQNFDVLCSLLDPCCSHFRFIQISSQVRTITVVQSLTFIATFTSLGIVHKSVLWPTNLFIHMFSVKGTSGGVLSNS